jgi:23S rRNA pseudouridine955/2504/2580 synthase/23S rRNA pseudouridine1911/1915/1917 synthase
MKRKTAFDVPAAAAGLALADFLASRFPYHDRAGWCERIRSGHVTVNAQMRLPDEALLAGDRLAYDTSDIPEPPVDFTIGIVSDDADLLIVNKSGNLPCHPGGRYFNHTLWAWLKDVRGMSEPSLVNRIDRETSGLVVVAKNPAAAHNCGKQFANRQVVKRYTVLVEADAFPSELNGGGWLLPDTASAVRKKCRVVLGSIADLPGPEAVWVETRFRLLAQRPGMALIEAEPLTGRLHQIRATLLALGYPVVGDKLYGRDETAFIRFCEGRLTDADRSVLRMDRQALHASGLSFRHPKFGLPVSYQIDIPDDMQRVLTSIDGDCRLLPLSGNAIITP